MRARYVDASVFVHAYIRPRRELKAHERGIKSNARAIVTRINEGEDVVTSTLKDAEIANVLENWMSLGEAAAIQQGLCALDSVRILATTRRDLLEALALGSEIALGAS